MAGRIPQSFIDELVARADLAELIGSRVPLKKQGKEFKACCPFHGEKTPSFTVVPDKGFYHCFGCGAHGTALGFLMDHDHLSFVEAVEDLAARVGLEVPRDESAAARSSPSEGLFVALDNAAEVFRRELETSDRARNYFKGRGLTGETAVKFGLGFAPDAWDTLVSQLGSNDAERMKLLQAGLIVERERKQGSNASPGHYDRFRDRVMFPIRDARGRTIGFGGRILDKGEPKYLNSPETELFHKGRELYGLYEARQASRTLTRLLVVEGYMDVVRLHQAGIEYAVATLGTATTPEHLARIFRVVNELVFCFDGDRAGRAAAWRALENSLSQLREGRQIRFLFLPDGHDPDSLVGAEGREAFEARLKQAVPLSEYFIKHLTSQADMESVDGRAQLGEMARPLLERIQPGIYRELMTDEVAKCVRMDGRRYVAAVEKAHGSRGQSAPTGYVRPEARHDVRNAPAISAGRGNLVRQAIRSLVLHPMIATRAPPYGELASNDRPGVPLLIQLLDDLRQHPCRNTGMLLERWRDRPELHSLTRLSRSEDLVTEEGAARELIGALEQLFPEARIQRLDELVRKQDREGLTEAESAELKEFLTRRTGSQSSIGQRT